MVRIDDNTIQVYQNKIIFVFYDQRSTLIKLKHLKYDWWKSQNLNVSVSFLKPFKINQNIYLITKYLKYLILFYLNL